MKTLSLNYADVFRFQLAVSSAVFAATIVLGATFGPAFYLVGLLIPVILTIRQGIEFDFTNAAYRKYKGFLSWKSGDWKPYASTNQLVILSKSGHHPTGNNPDRYYNERKQIFELYVMDATHLKKLYITTFDDLHEARKMSAKISELSGLSEAVYNPRR